MNVQVKKLPKSTYEVTATLPAAEVSKEIDAVTALFKQNVELPGFRKGKAPNNLVIEKVGEERIKREALQSLLERNFPAIMKEAELYPISNPSVKVDDIDPKKDLEVVITVATLPEVEVKDYHKVKVKKETPKKIEDKQIDEYLTSLFENWNKQNPSQEEQPKGVIYGASGHVVSQEKATPDDSFAQKLGTKDLADLKDKIRHELEIQETYRIEKDFENSILDEILRRTKTEAPDILITEELNRMITRMNMQIQQMGASFEDFLKAQGKTVDELRESWKETAEKNVKLDLALQKIAELANITVSDEEIQEQLKGHDHHEHSEEEKTQEESYYRHMLKQSKALEHLKSQSSK